MSSIVGRNAKITFEVDGEVYELEGRITTQYLINNFDFGEYIIHGGALCTPTRNALTSRPSWRVEIEGAMDARRVEQPTLVQLPVRETVDAVS